MKASYGVLLAALYGAQLAMAQEPFSAEDKALWIDRHNYFRMAALPWAATNMLKIQWSEELSTQATEAAKSCAAETAAGINAASVASDKSAVDQAMTAWVVRPGIDAFGKITAPKADGEPVGVGVYNSYTQVIWSSTNQVGCGRATCDGKVAVVCKYAPAGNDGDAPWYIHGAQGAGCPEGMASLAGLCGIADDPANKDIAPIPAGQNAYDVFKDFIANGQKALRGEPVDLPEEVDVAPSRAPNSTAPSSSPKPSSTPKKTTKPSTTPKTSSSPKPSSTPKKTTKAPKPSKDASAEGSADTGDKDEGEDDAPGKVKPGSGSGSFVNSADKSKAPTKSKAPAKDSSAAGDKDTSADDKGAEKEDEKNGNTPAEAKAAEADSPTPAEAEANSANNKSEGGSKDTGFSAAGVAGVVVLGCVLVAGIAVFASYRKNQQRQRDIMQNGGIHVL